MAFFKEEDEQQMAAQQNAAGGDADGFVPPKITFLYKLKRGVSPSSFGLNVARLAGIWV